MESYDFYLGKMKEAEQEFVDLTNEATLNEDYSEETVDRITMLGAEYLTVSKKFKMELDILHESASVLYEQRDPLKDKPAPLLPPEKLRLVRMYRNNLEQNYNAQEIVEAKVKQQINLFKKIGGQNGYGSYE